MASLGRAYCNTPGVCVGNGIYFDATQSGRSTGPNHGTDTQVKDEAYLRIDNSGPVLTGYYSEDGAERFVIGTHELNLTDPKVGMVATHSNVAGATALFDYFTAMEMP